MSHKLKVGSKVEIIGNIPFQLKKNPKPRLGTVTAIDGSYILVRPKYQRYECEFYPGELRLINSKEVCPMCGKAMKYRGFNSVCGYLWECLECKCDFTCPGEAD